MSSESTVYRPDRGSVLLGVLLVLSSLLLNKWALERVVAPDEHIQRAFSLVLIAAGQLLLFAGGLWLLVTRRAPSVPLALRRMVTVGLAAGIVLGVYGNLKAARIVDPDREAREAWDTMIASEEVILDLERELKKLSTGVMNLELPDSEGRPVFAERVRVVELSGSPPARTDEFPTVAMDSWSWPLDGGGRDLAASELRLWRPLLEHVRYFQNAKFFVVRGSFVSETRDRYEADVGFSATALMESDQIAWINSRQLVRFQRGLEKPAEGESQWRIDDWETQKLDVMGAKKPLFVETLGAVLGPEDLARARRSAHEELVLQSIIDADKFKAPNPWFHLASVDRHPGISVADVDRDGLDDIYVMDRETTSLLFRNRGDGTFEEVASRMGLDIEDFSAAAVFADFDNDGDSDGFVGRTLAPSMYLVNEGGRFVDRSQDLVEGGLPYLASSVNAVDYDGDGLLDVYVSTYAAQMIDSSEKNLAAALSSYLSSEDLAELERRLQPEVVGNKSMNYPGPPNVLLKNVGGGRFIFAADARELRVFRNTYQSTWADFDDDGDADVYLANDFSPNNLFRNDGDGKFVDVTAETETADIGFGMGASWGDYDNDGRQDLYVSNMYSKAGKRITGQLININLSFAKMAGGNTLFRNAEKRFERASGVSEPAMLVEAAGWSWGSQFLDADNDGFLDIFALSGHYTAPKAVDAGVDI